MKCYHALSPTAGIKVLDESFWRKKGLQARLLEAACPLPPLNYGEAITEYTPRRIPDA